MVDGGSLAPPCTPYTPHTPRTTILLEILGPRWDQDPKPQIPRYIWIRGRGSVPIVEGEVRRVVFPQISRSQLFSASREFWGSGEEIGDYHVLQVFRFRGGVRVTEATE